MATAEEIVVKLTAQTAQLKAGMAEGAAVVKATQDEMAASMQTSMNAFRQFDAITNQSVQSTEGLAQAQAALAAVQNSGAFTAEEIAAKQAIVSEAMVKVARDTTAASGAMGALTRNSRTMYSASALVTDAMSGQFSRSRREVAALANETGLMARAFQFALSPAGILAGAIGTLGIATVKAEEDLDDFDNAIERTNGYMGTSAGELQAAAQKIESLGVSYSDAKEAVIDLASSGRFTGEQLLQAATSAAEFAQLTGEKVSQVDKLLVQMATDPQKALDELVEKYHRVTPAQAEVIEQMIKEGDKAAATAALVQAMGTSVAESFDKQAQHAGMLDKVLTTLGRDFGEVWRGIGESLNVATGGGDAAEKLTMLQHRLADMRASGETTGGYAVAYQALQKQAAELQTIIDKQHQSAAAAKQTADAYAKGHPAQGTFAAFQKSGLGAIDINGNLTKQLQTAEAAMRKSYGDREQFEEEYWGTVLQKAQSGTAAYIQAWQRVQSLQQQLDERQLSESESLAQKQAEAARHGAEEAKRAAEGRARVEQQGSQEIQEDIKQAAAAQDAADRATLDGARQLATAKIAADRQAAQTAYDEGKISAAQLLQIQQNLVNQELAATIGYYREKERLDATDVAAVIRDQNAIKAARLKAQQEMSADLDKSLKLDEQKWKQYSQRMAGAMQNAVNSMIFQHQRLRDALASVGESIAETFMEAVVDKPLQAFIEGEAHKLMAAIGFGEQKAAVDDAQRTANQAADVADKTAMATRALGLTGINALASFAAAPWPIDIGAPAFAAAMVGVASPYLALASAAGGWERVPVDGMMTQLHKDEMVLPARIAEPVRKMARNGGSGGAAPHYHIHVQDTRGLKDFIRRNGMTLGSAIQRLGRNGHGYAR